MQHAEPKNPGSLIPAAAYVRMSTEHQQYSTDNQRDKILVYAKQRGMEVIRKRTVIPPLRAAA